MEETKWDPWVQKNYVTLEKASIEAEVKEGDDEVDVRESATPALYRMPIEMKVRTINLILLTSLSRSEAMQN